MRTLVRKIRTIRRLMGVLPRLIVAAVVVVTSFETPVLQHAHAEGERPHRHVDEPHSHHSHRASLSVEFPVIEGVTAHVHVFWLGCEFTLPAGLVSSDGNGSGLPDQQSDDGLPASGANDGCAIYQLDDDAHQFTPTVSDRSLVFIDLSSMELFAPAASDVRALSRTFSRPVILCDVARHERSGVQLV